MKVFGDVNLSVEIIDDENMYFDISGISNKFNKRFDRYTSRSDFKEYLKSVKNVHNLNETELIRKSGHQIKIHNVLLIDYARWINSDFAVWSDKIIFDIFKGDKILCDKQFEMQKKQLQIVQQNLKEVQLNKMKTYKDGFKSLRKYLKDNGIEMSEDVAWNILLDKGLIVEADIVVKRKILHDETLGRQDGFGVIEFNSRALDSIFAKFVVRHSTLFDKE